MFYTYSVSTAELSSAGWDQSLCRPIVNLKLLETSLSCSEGWCSCYGVDYPVGSGRGLLKRTLLFHHVPGETDYKYILMRLFDGNWTLNCSVFGKNFFELHSFILKRAYA
jgi:hypothetical protein